MLAYYAIYKDDITVDNPQPPAGIFILDTKTNDALLWNHRSKAWQYDPRLVLEFLDDDRNWDRVEEVDRATAERITVEITKASYGYIQELPDEDTIRWIFHWKGETPDRDSDDDPELKLMAERIRRERGE